VKRLIIGLLLAVLYVPAYSYSIEDAIVDSSEIIVTSRTMNALEMYVVTDGTITAASVVVTASSITVYETAGVSLAFSTAVAFATAEYDTIEEIADWLTNIDTTTLKIAPAIWVSSYQYTGTGSANLAIMTQQDILGSSNTVISTVTVNHGIEVTIPARSGEKWGLIQVTGDDIEFTGECRYRVYDGPSSTDDLLFSNEILTSGSPSEMYTPSLGLWNPTVGNALTVTIEASVLTRGKLIIVYAHK